MSLQPLIKWAGGKEQELKMIIPNIPKEFNNYYEPFIGGGALYFYLNHKNSFINDKSIELVNLYNTIKNEEPKFYEFLNHIILDWNILRDFIVENKEELLIFYNKANTSNLKVLVEDFLSNYRIKLNVLSCFNKSPSLMHHLYKKTMKLKEIELEAKNFKEKDILDTFECAFKGAYYTDLRDLYNLSFKVSLKIDPVSHSVLFFFIRSLCYSGMFRYNKNNEFNVPYGGIGYNSRNLQNKVDYYQSKDILELLNNTTIYNEDFEDFFKKSSPQENDFIFLDPPYDSEFSKYANNEFDKNDQERLANYLINECKANWMVVIKNTDYIYSLYNKENVFINSFDKAYAVNFKNRNDRTVKHLMITNYKF